MTEDEAKEKWCPFVRLLREDSEVSGLVTNRGDQDGTLNCIAFDCMAWRATTRPATTKDVAKCDLYGHGDLIPTGGYCGLAK